MAAGVVGAASADSWLGCLDSQYNNLYLLSVTKRNSNVALMLIFLSRLVNVSARSNDDVTERSGAGTCC